MIEWNETIPYDKDDVKHEEPRKNLPQEDILFLISRLGVIG